MKTSQEGTGFSDYAKFKAFLQTAGAKTIFWENANGMLNVTAHFAGGSSYWCSMNATEIADYHSTFDSSSNEVA